MSKRKQKDAVKNEEDSDNSIVNVDFDFFDPNPDVDYLAVKRLAAQLWQGDAESLQLQDLADLVLSQPQVGTTVKCDGKESDPYSFLTVINLRVHQNRTFVKALIDYVLSKSSSNPAFSATLKELLGPQGLQSQNHVGFVFSERLMNMPVQLMPVSYKMLAEEIQWAVEDNNPFRFSHYLFLSQIRKLSAEDVAELEKRVPPTKRQKAGTETTGSQTKVFPIHPEDEEIAKLSIFTTDFPYSNSITPDAESLGLDLGGRLMLMPAERLPQLVDAIAAAYPPPQAP
ncbi:p21-C-terminal region-binding protein-domain-containing protein [Irpex rosettiformis]|uniref:P21-C-terminal region-binding protein-domain-containing protein n=1 Tax=Irpex rosettiformis TaxID=378272 RepID=A0ACB8U6Z8_9APHY|nr:p21-C-terminal region-binding protein-domain-containing protein [Irpex rosettiformis]